jgi:hypothetical protein
LAYIVRHAAGEPQLAYRMLLEKGCAVADWLHRTVAGLATDRDPAPVTRKVRA